MIPLVKISSGTVEALLLYISIIGLLLFVATLLRLKITLFKKMFMPASLLAGLIALLLGPHFLKIIPKEIISGMGALPGQMISVVFACMLIGFKPEKGGKEITHDFFAGLGWMYSCSFLQIGLTSLLCAFLLTPMFGVNDMYGSVMEIGFAGGHGTAGGMIQVFNDLGWTDGGDIGMTTATIGLFTGIIGGMIIINYGVRKKYTAVLTKPADFGSTQEIFVGEKRVSGAYVTVSQDVVEPFALHAGLIGIAILIGWEICYVVKSFLGISMPLFPFAMVGGGIVNAVLQKTSFADLIDKETSARIQGLALEILVVGAMAAIEIPVLLKYWAPLLIGSVVIIALMVWFFMFYISPHIFEDAWFEQGIVRYGTFCGVTAVGYMLLRTCDPQMKTPAGTIFALINPLFSPFIAGGIVTSMTPMLLHKFGSLYVGAGFTLIALAILGAMRATLWIKNPKKVVR